MNVFDDLGDDTVETKDIAAAKIEFGINGGRQM
jgi:hypothetical protein